MRPASGTAVVHPTLRDVWVVGADGSGLRRVSDLGDATLSLAWAADGRHVYAHGSTGFWRIDTAGGGVEQLGKGDLAGRVQTLIAR